jgi:hypothetical protein
MFSLTICFGPASTPWILLFKEEEKAKAIYNDYVSCSVLPSGNNSVIAADDFGQAVAIPLSQINGMMLDDMDQSKQAYIERGLHNARAQARAQQLAAADPTIRAAAQGPAVMSPFPGGAPRFNG